jgi:hypothetical protein
VYSEGGESVRLRDDSLSRQADVSMPEVSDRQGGDNIPPPVEPVAGSNSFSGMVAGASGITPRSGG